MENSLNCRFCPLECDTRTDGQATHTHCCRSSCIREAWVPEKAEPSFVQCSKRPTSMLRGSNQRTQRLRVCFVRVSRRQLWQVPALLKQRVGLRLWGFPMPTQSEGFRVYDPKLLQDRTQLSNVQALNWMAATLYSPFISNGTLP